MTRKANSTKPSVAQNVISRFLKGNTCRRDMTAAWAKTEQALRVSEEESRRLMDMVPMHICRLSPDFHYMTVNKNFEDWYKFPREQVIGRHMSEIIGQDSFERLKPYLDEAMTGKRVSFVIHLPELYGGARYLEATYTPDVNDAGEVTSLVELADDITDRQYADMALQENEQRFRFLGELDMATRNLDNPGDIMDITTRMVVDYIQVTRCAYADVEEDGDHFTMRGDYADDHNLNAVPGHYSLAVFGTRVVNKLQSHRTLVIRNVQEELKEKDSAGAAAFAAIHIEAIIICPLIMDGKLQAMMAMHQSTPRNWTANEVRFLEIVAERSWSHIKRVSDNTKMRESEQQFRDLTNSVHQMIWVTRPDGYHEYYNNRWYEYTGVQQGSTHGDGWNGLFHPDDQARARKRWHESLDSGKPYEIEYRLRRADGVYRWVLGRAECVRDQKGNITKWYGTCTDIQDLIDAREQSEAANVAKTEFLSNMSHEIRTPMNAVIGLANILARSEPLTQKQRDYIKTLQMSSDSLLSLINDLLDIAKIEARTVELEEIPFSLTQIVQDIISMMASRAAEKGLTFTFGDECAAAKRYIGDPTRVRQIILNLCSNAMKFTEAGGIHIKITCNTADKDDFENVSISVIDTGIGIVPDKLETIFHKFVQADNSINRKYGGTGLGLAITKTLVEIMGGTISVVSQVNNGSDFTVVLPLRKDSETYQPERVIAPQEEEPQTEKLARILLVEDYAPNVLVASTFLTHFGYAHDVASNGMEAVQKIKANNYALVLMDIQMHGMNGFEATYLVRELEKINKSKRLPIIGMTAHAMAGYKERCLSAGMDDYISKPFDPAELERKIKDLVNAA